MVVTGFFAQCNLLMGECDLLFVTHLHCTNSQHPPGNHHSSHLLTMSYFQVITGARMAMKLSGHQYRWLAGGYDLEIGHF